MSAKTGFFVTIAVAIMLFVVMAFMMNGAPNAQAAPLAAPTPVTVYASGVAADVPVFYNTTVITQNGNSSVQAIQNHEKIDLQYILDETIVNTVTLKLQFSNDGTNWVDGPTIASGATADANAMQQYNLFGKQARINTAVTNAYPLTLTVIGVAK